MPVKKGMEIVVVGKDKASKAFGGVDKALGGLGKMAAGIAVGGLAAAGAAIVALGTGAVAAAKHLWDFSRDATDSMNLFAAQTGTSVEELGEFRDVATEVYKSGLGESFDDVTQSLAEVHKGLQLTGDDLAEATKKALMMEEVFGLDINESIRTVSSMMTNFGITSEEAFDALTWGSQKGLDRFGDLGDTLLEYSSDFKRLGFTVDEALGLLNAGLEAGAYNTDVVADGIREFGIRFTGMEQSAVDALESVGINTEEMFAKFSAGELTVADAMAEAIAAIAAIEDPIARAQAGAALFGSKWEDVGEDVFLAMGLAQTSIDDMAGSADEASERMEVGLGAAWERFKRQFEVSFLPLGDKLGEMLDEKIIPKLNEWAIWLEENLPKAIEKLMDWIDDLGGKIGDLVVWYDELSQRAGPELEASFESLVLELFEVKGSYDQLLISWALLMEALGLQESGVSDLQGTLINLAELGIRALEYPLQRLRAHLNKAKYGIDMLKGVVRKLRRAFQDLKDALARFELPWWLRPGSPTPLELGLLGIGKAIKNLPDLNVKLPSVDVSSAGGGGSSGSGNVVIHNHFGADSVRSDEDINRLSLQIERSFRLRSGMVMT